MGEFWFDFASTYSYIAAMRIEELCARADVALEWKPFLLGPIFALQGWNDSPFNLNLRRGAYMWRDMERLAKKHDLPWKRPSVFPRRSTLPARIACTIAEHPLCGKYVRAIFVANFGEDRDIGDERVVAAILDEVGFDASEIFRVVRSPERKEMLRANTNLAIELGIFGAPNCIAGGELFWGEESIEDAIAWSLAARG